jgi:hypothetical protein
MSLKPVTVFTGSDLEHADAFAPEKWTEILLDVDKALTVEPVDLKKLNRGTPPTPADVSPPVIPPAVAGNPPTIQHLPTPRTAAAANSVAPFPCVTIRFVGMASPYTAKGALEDFLPDAKSKGKTDTTASDTAVARQADQAAAQASASTAAKK